LCPLNPFDKTRCRYLEDDGPPSPSNAGQGAAGSNLFNLDEGLEASDDDANADTQHLRLSANQKSLDAAEDDSDEVRAHPRQHMLRHVFVSNAFRNSIGLSQRR
jgi:hypothetical protein